MLPAPYTPPKDSFELRVEELRNRGLFRRPPTPAVVVGHKHVQRDSKPPAGILAPPATVTEKLAGKDKLTPKESSAWLDDWLTRINAAP